MRVRSVHPVAKACTYVVCLGMFVVAGCGTETGAPTPAPQVAPTPFAVELVNAHAWRRDAPPLFSTKKRPRVILPDGLDGVRAFAGDAAVELAPHPTSAGHVAFELRFEPPGERFELRVEDGLGRRKTWPIEWIPANGAPLLAPVEALIGKARAARRAGAQTAETHRRDAADAADAAGLTSVAAAQWRALAHAARIRGDLPALDAALKAAAERVIEADRAGRLGLTYYRGLSAKLGGALREADAFLQQTVTEATHLGHHVYRDAALMAQASVRVRQGRFDAAFRAYARLAPDASSRRGARQIWHNNVAWALALGMGSQALPVDHSLAAWHLRESLTDTRDVAQQANTLANLAGVHLRAGAPRAALDALSLADTLGADATRASLGWRRLVAGELGQVLGDWARAERELSRAAGLGPVAEPVDPETGWRAVAALARVHAARGDRAGARALFREAVRQVDALSAGVELAETSGAYYAGRQRLFDDWARATLEDDSLPPAERAAQGWAIVEASQARVVRSLQRRNQAAQAELRTRTRRWLAARARFEAARAKAWSVPAAERAQWRARRESARADLERELRALVDASPRARPTSTRAVQAALPQGAVLLSVRRIDAVTHAFLVDATHVRHREVRGDDLLGPWAAQVRAAAHVFWVPGNVVVAQRLDQHPIEGRPLASHVAQSRLPFAGLLLTERRPTPEPPVRLVDPEGNLRWARDEAAQLPGRTLTGDAAHRSAVLEAIDGARLLHFAGHGVLRSDAPWDAHLRLARQTRLSLGDLLTARPAIGTVVLNGCSTGIDLDLGGEERIGLPTGLLLAGAGMVLATRVDVPDDAARRFIDRFYAAGGAEHPAVAFRDAVRGSLAATDPVWTQFELMGRP